MCLGALLLLGTTNLRAQAIASSPGWYSAPSHFTSATDSAGSSVRDSLGLIPPFTPATAPFAAPFIAPETLGQHVLIGTGAGALTGFVAAGLIGLSQGSFNGDGYGTLALVYFTAMGTAVGAAAGFVVGIVRVFNECMRVTCPATEGAG
jgi:hypothetical protein